MKSSMFNYVSKQKDKCYLYNSYIGTKSICEVSEEKIEKVSKCLDKPNFFDNQDPELVFLKDNGFLIDEDIDEKALRNSLYIKYVEEPTLNLIVHTTKNCNFRCQYCYLDFEPEMLEEDTQQRIVQFIKRRLSRSLNVKISWFGGEPLLGIDAIGNISEQVMDLCKRSKKQYVSSITTNGYLLTPENINKLIKWNVYSYTITIDGLKETHDQLRYLKGHGSTFDRIINNLIYIRDNVKCSKLRIIIRTNLTTKIAKNLDEYYQFFDELFGSDSRFSLFVRPVRDVGGERIHEIKDELLQADELDDAILSLSQREGKIQYNGNYTDLEPAGSTCPAICSGKYTISTAGDVSKCDSAEDKYIIGHLDEKGNLLAKGSKESEWETGCFRYDPKCEECFFSAACFKGTCPLIWMDKNEKNCCYLRTDEIDSLIQLYANSHNIPRI